MIQPSCRGSRWRQVLKTHELRAEVRVPITQRGMLGGSNDWHHCLIEDFSTKGFLIISTMTLKVGYVLELKCELFPKRILQCKVEVRHVSADCVGTMIVDIIDAGTRSCQEFIDEHSRTKRFT